MKFSLISFLFTVTSMVGYTQTTVKIGNNKIEVLGTKVGEVPLIPSKTEPDNRIKETYYFYDGSPITFAVHTQTNDDNPTLSVYHYSVGVKLKPVLTTVKSKTYKGGKAYVVNIDCNKKVCAKMDFYDAYTNGVANTLQNQTVSIMFMNKVKAEAFMQGIKSL